MANSKRLTQAVLAREDAERIARFLASNVRVQAHLDMPNKITGPVESENVVAEIRGREKPNEFVLLGAHLDSWELGTGALDNGCNAAMVIDAARVIHASGTIPRRSIRFVLFTGEEQGMLGSAAYARAHRAELDDMDAAIIFDSGIGRVTGYSLSGRKDVADAVKQALEPTKSMNANEITFDAEIGTDNFDFLLEGVPDAGRQSGTGQLHAQLSRRLRHIRQSGLPRTEKARSPGRHRSIRNRRSPATSRQAPIPRRNRDANERNRDGPTNEANGISGSLGKRRQRPRKVAPASLPASDEQETR